MPVLSRLRKRMYSCYSLQLPVSCVFLFRAHTPGLYTHVLKEKKKRSRICSHPLRTSLMSFCLSLRRSSHSWRPAPRSPLPGLLPLCRGSFRASPLLQYSLLWPLWASGQGAGVVRGDSLLDPRLLVRLRSLFVPVSVRPCCFAGVN